MVTATHETVLTPLSNGSYSGLLRLYNGHLAALCCGCSSDWVLYRVCRYRATLVDKLGILLDDITSSVGLSHPRLRVEVVSTNTT